MDLSNFDVRSAADEGADLHLKHPATGEPLFAKDGKTPFTIRVLGRDAEVVQKAVQTSNEQRAKGEIDETDAARMVLASTVAGWHEEMMLDGKPLRYSPKNAAVLLSDPRSDWIEEQIAPFSLSRRNFAQNMKKG
ncbi:MAG: hypothetical protein AAFX90_10090 [Pseudomonadota bacterium]